MADQALACIQMMDFEGKDEVERRISQNGTLFQQVQMMQQQLMQMAQLLQAAGIQMPGMAAQQGAEGAVETQPQPRQVGGTQNTGGATNAVRDRVKEIGNPTR